MRCQRRNNSKYGRNSRFVAEQQQGADPLDGQPFSGAGKANNLSGACAFYPAHGGAAAMPNNIKAKRLRLLIQAADRVGPARALRLAGRGKNSFTQAPGRASAKWATASPDSTTRVIRGLMSAIWRMQAGRNRRLSCLSTRTAPLTQGIKDAFFPGETALSALSMTSRV